MRVTKTDSFQLGIYQKDLFWKSLSEVYRILCRTLEALFVPLSPHSPFMLLSYLFCSSLLLLTDSPLPPLLTLHSWFRPSCFDPIPKIPWMKPLLATYQTQHFTNFIPQLQHFPYCFSCLLFLHSMLYLTYQIFTYFAYCLSSSIRT